jgi:hypothetical protein
VTSERLGLGRLAVVAEAAAQDGGAGERGEQGTAGGHVAGF